MVLRGDGAVSGVVNALVRIRPGDLVHSAYGWLDRRARRSALCALGYLGWRQRRREWLRCSGSGARGPLIRLALTEAAVFGLTFGVAVALGRTPPPPPPIVNPSIPAVEIGYDLAGPPTLARVLFDWRFDLVFGTAAIVFAIVYLAGVRRLRTPRRPLADRRVVAWLLRMSRCCWSRPRRASAATCLRCSACTWRRTCCCRC